MSNAIEGLDEVLANIKELGNPRKVKSSATKAARRAMNILRKDVAKRAKAIDDKDTTNKVWKNVKTKAKKSRNKEEVIMQVGLKGGAKKPTGNVPDSTWYWRFVELGTSSRPATPFMRTSFSTNKDTIQTEFVKEFNIEILKEINK